MIKSPCINICVMDPESGLCEGCYRTLDEIASWGSLSNKERDDILQVLEARAQTLEQDKVKAD